MTEDMGKGPAGVDSAREILDDARRVAAFGLRSGKLTDGALLDAIAEAEAKIVALPAGSAAQVEQLTPLSARLAEAQAAIHPMTLMDLRANDPFDGGRHLRQRAYTYSLAVLASGLLVLISALLVWQDRASQVMAVYDRGLPAQFEAIVTDLVTMTERFENKGELRTITALELSAIGSRIQDATKIVQEINANATLAAALDDAFLSPRMLRQTLFGLSPPQQSIQIPTPGLPRGPGDPSSDAMAEETAPTSPAPPTPIVEAGPTVRKVESIPPVVIDAACDDAGIDPKVVKAAVTDPPPRDNASARGMAASVKLYYRYRTMIECATGLTDQRLSLSDDSRHWSESDVSGQLATKLMVANSILLPAAFGILGAMIYHFRVFMDPLRPDVPLQRVMLRIFLGGFAGLTTYFFFTPQAQIAAGVAPSLAGLAIPFILGFSIDVFFRLLDRLVQQMNRWVDGIGAPPGGTTGNGG